MAIAVLIKRAVSPLAVRVCAAGSRAKAATLKVNVPWGLRASMVFAALRLAIQHVTLAAAIAIPLVLMERVLH